jgi:hypothetical protein
MRLETSAIAAMACVILLYGFGIGVLVTLALR